MTEEPAPADPIVDGRYRVEGWLGTGGQAVVLRVYDLRLGVPRALKVMLPSSARKTRLRDRFASEATTMAMLEHRNVLRVYDVAEADGLPYYVMELVEGGSLARRIQLLGPLEPREAVEAAIQVCAGLELAHARGVIHRDIKPQNVLVALDGTCKLLDFGIARLEDHRRTRAGAALGTEGYMAPEQARDASTVDARADVFSVGILTYVMISGRDPVEWLAGRGRERVPSSVRAELERATQEDPAARHASITELSQALERCAAALPPAVRARLLEAVPDTSDDEDEDAGSEIVDWLARMVGGPPPEAPKPAVERASTPLAPSKAPPASLGPPPPRSSASEARFPLPAPAHGVSLGAAPPPRDSASEARFPPQAPARSESVAAPETHGQPPRRPSVPLTPPPPAVESYEIGVDSVSPTTSKAPRRSNPPVEVAPPAEGEAEAGRVPLSWAVVGIFLVLVLLGGAAQLVSTVLDGWVAESERSAEVTAAAHAAENHLDFAVKADLSVVSMLAEMGADRRALDERVAAWEGSSREPDRSVAALALIDHLGSVAREVAAPGSPHSVRLEPPLQRLRAAASEYRATHRAPQPAVAR